ncbi:Uu.00g017380.m01.CDS01 [Anthostomella pinea]|uniref:Uu.00g017380.m01.CDS01 n=1 Tax=Anthostomella pinea TaxID=933095 RepID=A0AAI8VZJ6_9PEZI|nr:Uu.00g017380.m01.CDS01 [Anthostomella pinea]
MTSRSEQRPPRTTWFYVLPNAVHKETFVNLANTGHSQVPCPRTYEGCHLHSEASNNLNNQVGGYRIDYQMGIKADIASGRKANNSAGWAFGSNVPMGSGAGLPNSNRQLGGGNLSFAQSLSGSQPATPLDLTHRTMVGPTYEMGDSSISDPMASKLKPKKPKLVHKIHLQSSGPATTMDATSRPPFSSVVKGDTNLQADEDTGLPLDTPSDTPSALLRPGLPYASALRRSEFPALSNNSQLPSTNSSSLWSTGGSRNTGGTMQRNQPPSQQGQQEDFFSSSSSRLGSNQGGFRFGNQNSVPQPSQPQPNSIDEFPPLNNNPRNGNGEIGQERGSSLMSTLGFGAQGSATPGSLQPTRSGNGLLNALSANTRSTDGHSPDTPAAPGLPRPQELRSAGGHDEARQKPPGFREGSLASQSSPQDPAQLSEGRNLLGEIGGMSTDTPSGRTKDDQDTQSPSVHDPLAGMAPIDRWGLKGLRTLMNNYPDYNAAVTGIDPTTLGLDLASPAPISTQIYNLFNDAPPRPTIPDFRLPDCYSVTNVQPLENKINNFNEETLMWIFYSNPGDLKQHLAAHELYNRAWRWHKKLKLWLTKDDTMQPRFMSGAAEEGYYIVWNTTEWRKDRRHFVLHYADLESNNTGAAIG